MTHPLIGKTITALWLSPDDETLRVELTTGETIDAFCEGDCCSNTWIEDIINP